MKLAIITQSYADDFDICKLLCESVDKFVAKDIIHYVFVDDNDYSLFKGLANTRREILPKSCVIPRWLLKVPFRVRGHNIWISPLTIPVRGWILQQVVKLGVFKCVDADGYLNLDSEFVFIRPFKKELVDQNDKLLLHRQTREWNYHSRKLYIDMASKILKIKNGNYLWKSWYLSPHFCFRKDVLVKLAEKIENYSILNNWKLPLLNCYRFSEYMLYGIFVEHVLGIETSGHFASSDSFVFNQYPNQYKGDLQLFRKNVTNIPDNNIALYLQRVRRLRSDHGKSGFPSLNPIQYKSVVYNLWEKLNAK